jgi:hypothetical protein
MEGHYRRYHVARGQGWDLHAAMNRIQADSEDAIVIDDNQKGDHSFHIDVWADGEMINATDDEADAVSSLRKYRREHPKR